MLKVKDINSLFVPYGLSERPGGFLTTRRQNRGRVTSDE